MTPTSRATAMRSRPSLRRLAAGAIALAGLLLPRVALAQATSPTTLSVSGGAQPASQTAPTGQVQFGIRVPLKPNAENVLTVTAVDQAGQTATVNDLKIAQITLTDVVRAKVTATRLSTPEVKQLVAQGVIDIADPANYNVSRFVVVLTVGGQQVQVPVPVVSRIDETFAEGPPISVGCGSSLSVTDRAISIPCGGGGGGSSQDTPPLKLIPFEVAPAAPGLPSIPGVIIIEGRIKTLKEFFKVDLLLMNVSSLFTLTELTARLDVPAGDLSPVAPAGGSIVMPDLAPGTDATGNFIVRGDTKGIHTVTAHFGGRIVGSFLPAPVAFSGSASTDLEVKGPPQLDVTVAHPDFVVAGQPYDLTVTITNTDAELDALYASMAIDVGAGADLLDDATGQLIDGPVSRNLGDILKGQSITQTYRVMPLTSGAIVSCVAAADANINLSVAFLGAGPGCAIGTLPSQRVSPDGKPTVTVVPSHNTTGVNPATAIVALFSDTMIEPTITAGYAGASFTVESAAGVVDGTLSFADIFGGTSAIFQPRVPLAPDTTYTITVNPSVFNTAGLSLASGIVGRFTTSPAAPVPDTIAPTVALAVEAPFTATAVSRGQSVPVAAQVADAQGVTRVDVYVDGLLVDAKKGSAPQRYLIETATMAAGTSHLVEARAFDAAGNAGSGTLSLQIAPDQQPPTVALLANATVGQGRTLKVLAQATDDTRVGRVDLFLDGAITPLASQQVDPFAFDVDTTGLSSGSHQLVAVATDGAGNQAQAAATFSITADTVPPQLALVSPQATRFRAGVPVAFAAQAIDDTAVASITYTLDAEAQPRGTGDSYSLSTTGLAIGTHLMTIVAADTSNNRTTITVSFDLANLPADTTPPPPVAVGLVTLSTVSPGIIGVAGAAGAAEPAARVLVTNQTSQAGGGAVASPTGAFTTQVDAGGGDVLLLVAIDDSGNTSTPVTTTVPVPATLVSLVVTPSSAPLTRTHTSEQLGVVGVFSDNTQQILTGGLTFTSSAPTVASATSGGLVLPGQNGSAVITVASAVAGVAPVAVPVSVNFTSVVGLAATPNPLALHGIGQSQTLTVSALFSDNTSGTFSGTARFATSNPAVAVVDGSGRVTSTGIGTASIAVAATGLPSVQVLVTVSAVQPTDIVVAPASASFTALGATQLLTVQYRYSDGTTGGGQFPVTYQSLDTAVASVTAAGLITAVGEGATSVVVSSQGFTANVPVSVSVPTTLPPPVITSLGRPVAGHGDTLAILGQNFAGAPALNFVTISGLRATVLGASAERLIVDVPEGAVTGPVQVRVAGQSSNTDTLAVYARLARTILDAAAFQATPGAGQSVGLGSASVYLYPGDTVVVSGDPHTINGSTWSGLVPPAVTGTLTLSVNGTDVTLTPSGQPIDVTSFLPTVSQPTLVTLGLRVTESGGVASSTGLAIVAGPAGTGAFAGQRFMLGDGIDDQVTIRFRVNAPDGTKFAATAVNWFRTDGGCCNGSVGGALLNGAATPNDSSFRTYTAQGGEVAVTYADSGVLTDMRGPRSAWVALVTADAAGSRTAQTPIADAEVKITSLDSASVLPQQTSVLADGVDRPFVVDLNSVRDGSGNRITDRTQIAVTAINWYRRSDGGCCNNSAGGAISGGVATPNDGSFRTVTLAGGAAQFTYSAGPVTLTAGTTDTAVLALTQADGNASRRTQTPFAEGRVVRSAPSSTLTSIVAVPSTLPAVGSDSRSVITLTGLVDALGRPVPDGSRVAVTTTNWYRQADGGCCNSSFGGTILGGIGAPNDGNFRSFVVTGGSVSFTYSNAGLVLDRGATATTVVAVLPATGNGSRIGLTPFAEVRIVQGGLTSATIVASPASTLADGARRPVAVSITNLRDALGNLVPDGTNIALTAVNWYRRGDGGCCNNSAGGVFIDGVATPNDGNFRTYTVANGRVDATYSAENVTLLSPTDIRSAVIAATAANTAGSRVTQTPFAEGTVALSSAVAASAVASPPTLYTDRQAHTSVVTITGITDAQGVPVPDGTKVAITAASWYRLSDGGCCNGSATGTMLGGEATPNDSNFRTYTVVNGQVSATYSNSGLFVDTANTAPVVLSVLPATPGANRIGTLPMAAASVTLVGPDSATFVGPATVSPGGSVSLTLTNLRDAAGNLIPDGARVAITTANWFNRDGSFGNGSAGGGLTGGVGTPNDGNFRTFTVSGGQVTVTVNAPATANVTSVLSVLSADGTGNRNANRPFAIFAVRVQ